MCLPDILEDMKEECQKYGSVVSLLIPKENPGKGQVRLLIYEPSIFKMFQLNYRSHRELSELEIFVIQMY